MPAWASMSTKQDPNAALRGKLEGDGLEIGQEGRMGGLDRLHLCNTEPTQN